MFATHPASALSATDKAQFSRPEDGRLRSHLPVLRAAHQRGRRTGNDGGNRHGRNLVHFVRLGPSTSPRMGQLAVWKLHGYGGGIFVPFRTPPQANPAAATAPAVTSWIRSRAPSTACTVPAPTLRFVLDFNFAYNPSCAYNEAWACPLRGPLEPARRRNPRRRQYRASPFPGTSRRRTDVGCLHDPMHPRRIARVRPLSPPQIRPNSFSWPTTPPDFGSDAGRLWTVVDCPFPGSPANASSPPRTGWEPAPWSPKDSFTFLAPQCPANVLGMAHNTGQAGRDLPPQAFHKAATSVVGPGDAIELAPGRACGPGSGTDYRRRAHRPRIDPGECTDRRPRLHHRQRRHGPRPAENGRPVDQRQEPGHVHAGRTVDRDGPGWTPPFHRHRAQRHGTAAGQLRGPRLGRGRNPGLPDVLHDASPRRPGPHGVPRRKRAASPRRHRHVPGGGYRRTDEPGDGRSPDGNPPA